MRKVNKVIALLITICMFTTIFTNISVTEVLANTDEKESTIIDVTDFGADPSGKRDSTIAIQKALEAAKEVDGNVKLNFPKGEYSIYKDFAEQRQYHTSNTSSLNNPTKWIGILIEDQNNLTVEGNGSLFNIHGDIMAIAVVRSENVILQNFVVDYEVPDTMDVTFVGQGEEDGKPYTDIYIPSNYNYKISEDGKHITWTSELSPYTGKPYWTDQDTLGGYLVIYKGYDETVRRHQTNIVYEGESINDADPFAGLENITEQGNNILRFQYKNRRPEAQEVGNVALLSNSARRRTAGAFIWESKNTLVKDIDVHYLSGFGWLTQMSENTEFNGVDFLPREGTGKYTTSNADQIHVSGASGYFNVIDCDFSMAHDDPINVHGTYLRVEEVIDNKTLKLKYIHSQQGGFPAYFPGDEVMFYSRLNLEVPTGADENKTFIVESAINPGEEYNGSKLSMRETVVTFEEPFSDDVLNSLKVKIKRGTDPNANVESEPLYVAENVTYAPNVHIKGNIMRSIPTRGILCTTRNEVVIEENVFESLAMASIYLSNDADYWYESGPIRNMTIRNNTFNVRPTGQTEWSTVSPIFVDPVIVNKAVAAPGYTLPEVKGDPVHQNITIDGNEFNMAAFNLITAKGVMGMTFSNNKIVRDSVNMALGLTSEKENLAIGEKITLNTTANETILNTDAFIFENCKNINIENNTYDFGINMNVKFKGTDESELNIVNDDLTVNGSANITTIDDKVQLLSSNPEVVKINEEGEAVAISEGTSEIIAYYNWRGSLVKSEPITITVDGGEYVSSLEIIGDGIIEEVSGTVNLASNYSGEGKVNWNIVNAIDGKETNGADINENGVVTGYKDGIYKVTAEIGGATATKLISVSLPYSFGIKGENNEALKDEFTVLRENSLNWRGIGEEDSIEIIGETGDLYGGNNSAKNIITFNIPNEIPKDDIRVQVTISGLPRVGDNYNSAGLLLYKDDDNYIRIGTKGHQAGIALDNEINRSDVESTFGLPLNNRCATFEIEKINGVIKVRYKDEDGSKQWSEQHLLGENSGLGDDYKIALTAWTKNVVPMTAKFSGLKVAKASETTTESLSKQSPILIFNEMPNSAPVVENIEITNGATIGDIVNVTYNFVDAENHNMKSVIYAWSYMDNNRVVTEYTTDPSFKVKSEGELECRIYATDEYGKPNKNVAAVKTEISASSEESYLLKSLSINGNLIKEFDSAKYEYNYDIPNGVNIFTLNYLLVNNSLGEVKIVNSKGNELSENNGIYEIPSDNIVKILRVEGLEVKETYTINFIPHLKNKAGIYDISIAGEEPQLIKEGASSYFVSLPDENNIEKLSFTTDEGVKDVKVYRSFYMNPIEGTLENNNFTTENIDLYCGLNIFNIDVTAEDGFVERHRVHVFRSGYNEAYATAIKLNDKLIDGFDPNKTDYRVNITPEEAENLVVDSTIVEGKDATVSITVNGVRTEGSKAIINNLKSGLNDVIISVKAEDLVTTTNYNLSIIVESEDNADLLNITTDGIRISPAFNPDTLNYTAETNNESFIINAVSQHKEATVEIISGKESFKGKSSVTAELPLYGGLNETIVKVTSPDNTVKEYKIVVDVNGYYYLSDLEYESAEIGYGSLQLDKNPNGGTIRLPNESGNPISFEKGLGAHATSRLVYNIEGMDYIRFNSFVGIDYFQYENPDAPSSVTFKVYFDDNAEAAWQSPVMYRDTAALEVDLDITNVKKITLVADAGEYNWNDHAIWADAKFIKEMKSPPENDSNVIKTHLEIAVEEANKVTEEELSKVVLVVANEFKSALTEAKAILENSNATQAEVNKSFDRLSDVMQMLSFYKGDKTNLIELVNRIEALDESKYISITWNNLQQELENAKGIITDENALDDDVSKGYERLLRSFLSLRLKPNKELLKDLINQANSIDKNLYTRESLQNLEKALNNANDVFNDENSTEKDILTAENNLKTAIDNLESKSSNGENNGSKNEGLSNVSSNNSTNTDINNINKNTSKLPRTGKESPLVGIALITSIIGIVLVKQKKRY